MSRTVTLILPGLYDSGPEHWQSYWERADPACRRVVQADWDTPRRADWVARLDAEIVALGTTAWGATSWPTGRRRRRPSAAPGCTARFSWRRPTLTRRRRPRAHR